MNISNYTDVVQKWIEQIENYKMVDPEVTIKCCADLIEYATEKEDITLLGYGYYCCGEVYYALNDGKNFYDSLTQAVRYLDQAGEYKLMACCYNFLGIKAFNSGNIPLAYEYYTTGIKYSVSHEIYDIEALMNINLGVLFYRNGRFQEAQRFFKRASDYYANCVKTEYVHSFMVALECNRVKALVALGYFESAEDSVASIKKEHWPFVTQLDRNITYCAEAILYHEQGDFEKRDDVIKIISKEIVKNMAILDYFDDYYDYAKMLLSTDLSEAFWLVVDVIEPLLRDAGSTDLMLKIISLKIQFYRKYGKSAEYLQASGLYYELSEHMADETKDMVNNVINLRQSLEAANQLRMKVEEENQILMEKSEMDPMTKIANRFRLNDYSEEIFTEAYTRGESIAVCMMDVDFFKEYNDNYGHQKGDECLIAVANTLREMAVAHDGFCARYGGDEFVIIYHGITVEQAAEYAAELKAKILEKNIEHQFSKCIPQVTLSQGMCCDVPEKGKRMWDFLHQADENLYSIKQVSRNNYCVSDLGKNTIRTGGDEE